MKHADNSHGNYKSYFLGFSLSIILTLIAYFIVVNGSLPAFKTHIILGALASLQLLVQLIFFLHLASEEKPRWNLKSFIFTFITVIIVIVGSLWVMYNLDYNMMSF